MSGFVLLKLLSVVLTDKSGTIYWFTDIQMMSVTELQVHTSIYRTGILMMNYCLLSKWFYLLQPTFIFTFHNLHITAPLRDLHKGITLNKK